MWCVVYRWIVEKNKVLIYPATANIEPRITFTTALHAGKKRYCFQDVYFTENDRDFFYLFDSNFNFAHFSASDIVFPCAFNYDRSTRKWNRIKLKVLVKIRLKFQRSYEGLVSHTTQFHFIISCGKCNGIKSETVGNNSAVLILN